jgi:hypothetical protein
MEMSGSFYASTALLQRKEGPIRQKRRLIEPQNLSGHDRKICEGEPVNMSQMEIKQLYWK